MPSSTRSNKETQLLFSPDPASLERLIRKEARSLSTDNNTSVLLDSAQPPSIQTSVPSTDSRSPLSTDNTNLSTTDIIHPTSIDIPSRTSIDTEPRDMVAPLILVRDNNGDLHDQEGHLRNAVGPDTCLSILASCDRYSQGKAYTFIYARIEVGRGDCQTGLAKLLTSRSYARFTEEWSICLARGSCRGDEGPSIDDTAFVSIDGDARIWVEHIL
ncbi:hypothetical protein F2Q69_00043196 [Brassica cretica]|uniref:Uncharacterized protein n=1 Tax=Brassica cretica TaxID=69181 RepID=A0A8S9NQM6_BRACR|nr:hypothetical protein F2Q69_00043196 [Brassica cretica]